MNLAASAVPVDLLRPGPAAPAAADTRERIKATAADYESAFLSIMFAQMFKDVDAGAFGGGKGETMFQSFLMDAFSKQTARSGGIGLADAVQREMLKLQGLEG
jgi:peptidoglycan hydrolase FlgJ